MAFVIRSTRPTQVGNGRRASSLISPAPAPVIILSWLSDLGYLISVILSSLRLASILLSHGPLGPAPGRPVDGGPEGQGWKWVAEKKIYCVQRLERSRR